MNIVITCGYNQSLHAIALINELKKQGHTIVGCIIVKTYQYKRLKQKIKMYGIKTLIQKFQNAVLNKENELSKETFYIKRYLENTNVTSVSVKDLCKRLRIQYLSINNLNENKVHRYLSIHNVDLIVYAGGGILRKKILNLSKYGAINAHSGYLPFFRGMNVVEWSLLYGVPPTITVHMISTGIDTGDILYYEEVPIDEEYSLVDLRGKAVVTEVKSLLKVISNFENYYQNKTTQNEKEGKQFFVMHIALKKIVEKYLSYQLLSKRNVEEKRFRFN
jgi:methionyl-tRNA formyltransferase